jgi:hypothetical protein
MTIIRIGRDTSKHVAKRLIGPLLASGGDPAFRRDDDAGDARRDALA